MSSAEGPENSSGDQQKPAFDSELAEEAAGGRDQNGYPRLNLSSSSELIAIDEEAVLRRAAAELAERKAEVRARALIDLAREEGATAIERIAESLEDESLTIRSAAVKALYDIDANRAASLINGLLREDSYDRRHKIGSALAGSNLASEAINRLNQGNGDEYDALSFIFLLAKAGVVAQLMPIIEAHSNLALRLALIKLLAASGQREVINSFHDLMLNGSLDHDVRSAVMAALYRGNSRAETR